MAEKRVEHEIERRKPNISEHYKGVKFHQLAPGITTHPLVRSGRPCMEGTGITVANIASLQNHHNMDARQIANRLRLSGIDIIRGPLGADDSVHLKRATGMGRVVCTEDEDFLKLAAQEQHMPASSRAFRMSIQLETG